MRFRIFIALISAFGVGAVVSAVQFELSHETHLEADSNYTVQQADRRAELGEGALKRAIRQLDLLVAYYEASPRVTHAEMDEYLQSVWVHTPNWGSYAQLPVAIGWVDVSRAPDEAYLFYQGGSPGKIVFSKRFGAVLDDIVVRTHKGSGALLYRGRPDADDFDGTGGHYFTILKSASKMLPDGRRAMQGTAFAVMDLQALMTETIPETGTAPMMTVTFGSDRKDTILNETGSLDPSQTSYLPVWDPPTRELDIEGQQISVGFYRDPDWSYSLSTSKNELNAATARTAFLIGGGVALLLFLSSLYFILQNTRLRDLKRRAEAAAVAKSDFLASMSHEIRTPMNGIFGMTELLAKTGLTQQQKRYVDTVLFSAEGLLVIIDDILDLSKLEVGKMDLEPAPTDVVDAVNQVTRLLSVKARRKALELNLRVAPDFPGCVMVDPGRLRQVVTNILANAVKFTERGEILVTLDTVDRNQPEDDRIWMRISVRDTGIGIAEENIEKVFDRFAQSDESTTRRFGGTGLGLAICKQFVELMGGQIGVESDAGIGSTFWFEIPVEAAVSGTAGKISGAELLGQRILVVEDSSLSAELIEEVLASAGASVATCRKSENALPALLQAQADGEPFDVALLDYQMPGTKGDEVARSIRGEPALNGIQLILISAVHPGHLKSGTSSGLFDGAVAKPFKPTALVQQIRACLDPSIAPADESLVARCAPAETKEKPFIGRRILVAEDSAINQAYIRETLQQFGCAVTIAENGEEALRRVADSAYDMVLMDCHMPIMDGYEATAEMEKLFESGAVARIPVIALTADVMAENRERCRKAGMVEYLSKPIRQEVLAKTMAHWLGQGGATAAAAVDVPLEPAASDISAQPNPEAEIPPASSASAAGVPPEIEAAAYVDDEVVNNGLELFEEDFWPLVDRYLDDLVNYVDAIDKAFEEKRHADIHMPVHSIKSSSRQIGAMRLGEVAAWVEKFVMPGEEIDLAGLEPALDNLRETSETTREKLADKRVA